MNIAPAQPLAPASAPASAPAFDPDAYLAQPPPAPAFDPDQWLRANNGTLSGLAANVELAGKQSAQAFDMFGLMAQGDQVRQAPEARQRLSTFEQEAAQQRPAVAPAARAEQLRVLDRRRRQLESEAAGAQAQAERASAGAEVTLDAMTKRAKEIPVLAAQLSPDIQDWNEAHGWDAVNAFAANPFEVTANTILPSLVGSAPAVAAGIAGSAFGPAGTAAGTAAGSFAVEYTHSILDSLQQAGVDFTDKAAIRSAIQDEEKLAAAQQYALERGVPIAVFDGFTAGVAGRILKPALGAGARKVGIATAKEMGVQAIGGAGGEAAAGIASGEPGDMKSMFQEAIGELAPIEAVANVRGELRRPAFDPDAYLATPPTAPTGPGLESISVPVTSADTRTSAFFPTTAPTAPAATGPSPATPAATTPPTAAPAAPAAAAPPAAPQSVIAAPSPEPATPEPIVTPPAPAPRRLTPTQQAARDAEDAYRAEMEAELRNPEGLTGVEKFSAVLERAGGLPSPKSVHYAEAKGELDRLREGLASLRKVQRAPKLHTGFFAGDQSLDTLAEALREAGFDQAQTGDDVLRMAEEYLTQGRNPLGIRQEIAEEDMPFSKQPGTPAATEEARLQKLVRDQWRAVGERGGPRVVTVKDANEIPGNLGGKEVRTAVAGGKAIVEAYFLPERQSRSGEVRPRTIVIVLDGARNIAARREMAFDQRVRQLGLHELAHHYGALGTLFPDAKHRRTYNGIIDGLLTRLAKTDPDLLAYLTKPAAEGGYGYDLSNAEDRAHAAEEYLARQHEQSKAVPGWAAKTIAQIKALLRTAFPKLAWSDADIRTLLDSARRRGEKMSVPASSPTIRMAQQPATEEEKWATTKAGFKIVKKSGGTAYGSRYYEVLFKGDWYSVRLSNHENTTGNMDVLKSKALDREYLRRQPEIVATGMHAPHDINIVLSSSVETEAEAAKIIRQTLDALGPLEKFKWETGEVFGGDETVKSANTQEDVRRAELARYWHAAVKPKLVVWAQRGLATTDKMMPYWTKANGAVRAAEIRAESAANLQRATEIAAGAPVKPYDQTLAKFATALDDEARTRQAPENKLFGSAQALNKARDTVTALYRGEISAEKGQSRAENSTDMRGSGPKSLATSKTGEAQIDTPAHPVNAKFSAQPAGQKERGHVATTGRMTEVSDTVKGRLAAMYDPTTAEETNRRANDTINALGMDEAYEQVTTANQTLDQDAMALAHHLALRLQQQGLDRRASKVRQVMAEQATDHARALWYISTIAKTPAERLADDAAKLTTQTIKDHGLDAELAAQLAEIERLTAELDALRQSHATTAIVDVSAIIEEATKLSPEEKVRLGQKLRDALTMATNPATSKQAENKLTGLLKAAGMRQTPAEALAKRLIAQVAREMQKAQERLLKELAKMPPTKLRLPKGALEKLIVLNRAGKLDESALHRAIAARFGVPVFTPEMARKIRELQREYDAAPDPQLKLAFGLEMMDTLHSMVPASVATKAKTLQTMAMLFGRPLVAIRNIGGNVIVAGFNLAADGLNAYFWDPTLSVVIRKAGGVGARTIGSAGVAERFRGLARPWQDYQTGLAHAQAMGRVGTWRDGLRTVLTLARLSSRGVLEMSDIKRGQSAVFTNATMRMIENGLVLQQGVADRAFWASQFQASIAQQMSAAAANGQELLAPTAPMVAIAQLEANKATFQDDNAAGKFLKALEQTLNFPTAALIEFAKRGLDVEAYQTPTARESMQASMRYGLGSAVVAFTKVPASIALQGAVDFSPLGFAKLLPDLVRGLVGKPVDRRAFNQILSKATVGTAGLVGMGYWLASLGIMSALPDDDRDREELRRKAGFGQYRFNLSALLRLGLSFDFKTKQTPQQGDKIYTYDWAQPVAIPLAMGAEMAAAQERDALAGLRGKPTLGNLTQALLGGLRSLESLPMLSGLTSMARKVGQEGIVQGAAETAAGVPSNFLPGVIADLNKYFDNTSRETRAGNVVQRELAQMQSQIPVLAQRLPAKADTFGEAQTRYQAGTNQFLNVYLSPAARSRFRTDPALQEIDRLYAATGDRTVIPGRLTARTMKVNGADLELTNDQIAAMQRYIGAASMAEIRNIMAQPSTARLDDPTKAKMFASAIADAGQAAKIALLGQEPPRPIPRGIRWALATGEDLGLNNPPRR